MAVVIRYFSTSSAGAADGTTWADRAALFSGGNWSSVITGFGFASGSNGMQALIGPGTYTCAQTLALGLFSSSPSAPNPLILHGCDSNGVLLSPPDHDWTPASAFDVTGLPEINSTTDIATYNLSTNFSGSRLIRYTSSGRTGGAVVSNGTHSWCAFENAASGSSAVAMQSALVVSSLAKCTGSQYNAVVLNPGILHRVRVEGVTGSSGNRNGVNSNGSAPVLSEICITGVGGDGYSSAAVTASAAAYLTRFHITNCGGSGIKGTTTGSQSAMWHIVNSIITGCGAYGINPQSSRFLVVNTRLRDNTSGNFNTMGNFPVDMDIYTTDSDDASEYVDSANGDFRIKRTALTWGRNFGITDEIPNNPIGHLIQAGRGDAY